MTDYTYVDIYDFMQTQEITVTCHGPEKKGCSFGDQVVIMIKES